MKNVYQQNAFRILGVFGNSSRAAIRDASQALRTRIKVGGAVNASDPLSKYDQIALNESNIREAFNTLENPAMRLRERLFWFEEITASDKIALIKLVSKDVNEARRILESNKTYSSTANLARLLHSTCIFTYPDAEDINRWNEAFRMWKTTLENDDFWNHFLQVERESGFEPQVTKAEILALREESWNLILQPSKSFLESAIINDRDDVAQRHFQVIQNSGAPHSLLSLIESDAVSPIEREAEKKSDKIVSNMKRDIPNYGKSNTKSEEEKIYAKVICDKAYQNCQTALFPLIIQVEKITGSNSEWVKRLKEIASTTLRSISIAYHNEAESAQTSEKLLKEAQYYGEGTLFEERLQKDLETISKHVQNEKVWGNLKPIKNAPALFTFNGIGTTIYGQTDIDSESGTYLTTLYLVFLYIPILPLARYRVKSAGDKKYSFLGKAAFRTLDKIHVAVAVALLGWVVLQINMENVTSQKPLYKGNYGVDQAKPLSNTPSTSSSEKSLDKPDLSNLKSEIENGELQLKRYDRDLEKIANKLKSYRSQIDFYQSRIEQIERDNEAGLSIDQSDYQSALTQHNEYVELHNVALGRYNRKVAEAKRLSEDINQKINDYNKLIESR